MKTQRFKKYNFSREIHGKLDFLKEYVVKLQHRVQKYQDEARHGKALKGLLERYFK